MTNFCANCGSELNESQMCLCQTQPIEEVEKEIDSEVNYSQVTVESDKKSIEFEIDVEKIKNYLSRLFGCLVSGIKRPITTFEYLVKNQSFDLGIGLLVLSSLVTMAIVMILYRSIVGGVTATLFSDIFPYGIGMKLLFNVALYFNLLPTLLFTAFILIFQLLILKKANFKDIFTICGGSHLVIIMAQIASLVGLILPQLVLPIIFIGNIAGLILVYSGVKQRYGLSKDTAFWVITTSSLGSLLVYQYFASEIISEKFFNILYQLEYILNSW